MRMAVNQGMGQEYDFQGPGWKYQQVTAGEGWAQSLGHISGSGLSDYTDGSALFQSNIHGNES